MLRVSRELLACRRTESRQLTARSPCTTRRPLLAQPVDDSGQSLTLIIVPDYTYQQQTDTLSLFSVIGFSPEVTFATSFTSALCQKNVSRELKFSRH